MDRTVTSKRLQILVVLACAISGSSCGADGSPTPDFPDSANTHDTWTIGQGAASILDLATVFWNSGLPSPAPPVESEIRSFAQASGIRLPQVAAGLGAIALPGLDAAARSATVPEGCTVTARGGWIVPDVDVDQDGVPDNAYYRSECLWTDSLSDPDTTSYSYYLIEVHIVQLTDALRGWDFTERIVIRTGNSAGILESQDERTHELTSLRAGEGRSLFSRTDYYEQRSDTGGSALARYTATVSIQQDATYHPDSTVVVGAPLPSGEVTVTGRWYAYSSELQNYDFRVSTLTPIRLNGGCAAAHGAYPFDSGALLSLLNGRAAAAQAVTTFTNCGVDPTVVTSGTTDPTP